MYIKTVVGRFVFVLCKLVISHVESLETGTERVKCYDMRRNVTFSKILYYRGCDNIDL
jgi:hypothetical protein